MWNALRTLTVGLLAIVPATLCSQAGFSQANLPSAAHPQMPTGAAAPATGAETVTMRLEMFAVAGVHVMTIHETLTEANDRYAITTDLQSRGLADVFVSLQSRSEAQGRLSGGRAVAAALVSDTRRNGVDRHTRAVFAADGTVTGESTPPSSEPRTPITPAMLRGTTDEMTAYYMLERQLGHNGSCALTVPVFDGRRRYDLVFSDGTPEVLTATSDNRFSGPTKVCELTERKIAGFPVDTSRRELVDSGRMWFARLLPGAFMVPVRMEFNTELGEVTAYLAELRGHGVDLHLME